MSVQMLQDNITEMFILMILFMFLLLARLAYSLWKDPYIQRGHKKVLLVTVGLVASLLIQSFCDNMLSSGETFNIIRMSVSIYGYVVRPLLITLFASVLVVSRTQIWSWFLVAFNGFLYLTNPIHKLCFEISENNVFIRGPLGYTCHVISIVLLANVFFLVIREYWRGRKQSMMLPFFNVLAILIAIILDSTLLDNSNKPITALIAELVASCIFFYIWLHLQFVREHEEALKADQRIQIMMSQIQPHFLYNTLATIKALCVKSPETAAQTIEKFSRYLRQNLESLDKSELIPLEQEMEHVRIYTEIEMLMFPYIHVQYEIEDDDFRLPALTIQPLVENAIRHGVRAKQDGNVTIAVRKDEKGHTIVISDNGLGFDPDTLGKLQGTHIGIRNVMERLEKLCSGTMEIESEKGKGTRITLFIPAEEIR